MRTCAHDLYGIKNRKGASAVERLSPDAAATAPTDHLTVNLYPRLIVATRWMARTDTSRGISRTLAPAGTCAEASVARASAGRPRSVANRQHCVVASEAWAGGSGATMWPSTTKWHRAWRRSTTTYLVSSYDAIQSSATHLACQLVAVSTDAHSHQTTTLQLSH